MLDEKPVLINISMRHIPDNRISHRKINCLRTPIVCRHSNCISTFRILYSSLLLEDPLDLDEGEAVRLPDGERGPDGHGGDHGAE